MIWFMHLKDQGPPGFLSRITTWGDSGSREREREALTILQVRGEDSLALLRGKDPVGLGCSLKTKKSLRKDSGASNFLGRWIPRSTVRERARDREGRDAHRGCMH